MVDERNGLLLDLLRQANLPYEGLARRVNELGAKQGVRLTYDKSSVSHWTKGKQPRGMTPFLVAQVLAEKLQRPVSVADIGFRVDRELELASSSLISQKDLSRALTVAADLGKADVDRREFLYVLPFSIAAAAAPQRDWLLHLLEVQRHEGPRIHMHHVDGVRLMMESFIKADLRFGGDHARTSLVTYLTSDVIPLLQRSHSSDAPNLALFNASAELYLTLGWMTYDVGSFGLAQRYLMQGLYLAKEAGGQGLAAGSQILSALSHIATSTNEPDEGVRLAKAASFSAQKAGSRPSLVRAYAMEARAYARMKSAQDSVMAIDAAEAAQQGEPNPDEPSWMAFQDSAYLANQMAYCFRELDDRLNMKKFAEHSMTNSSGRQVVTNDCYRATALLRDGDFAGACELFMPAAAQADVMHSRIAGQIVHEFSSEVPQYVAGDDLRDFHAKIRESSL